MTTLTQFTEIKKVQARAAFIDAAWTDECFDRLAELARDVGMEPGEADKIIARIAEARADMKPPGASFDCAAHDSDHGPAAPGLMMR